jgi:DNA-directed RNA polymerase specialized sigma24 family protein
MRKADLNKPVHGDERAAALAALSDDQRKRLAAYARVMSKGTGDEHEDLLQQAQVRWLASKKPVEGPEQTENFLRGAMCNLRYNAFRHQRVVRRLDGVRAVADPDDQEEPVEQGADPAASTEGPLFVQQVYDLCADDEELQLLLTAQADNATPDEIRAELQWDDKKYKAVQKRKIRAVARWTLQGKLK